MTYRKTKRDTNHLPTMRELKARGYSVGDMASVGNSFPDLIVAGGNRTVLIELKEDAGHIYLGQLEFMSAWSGYCAFAKDVETCIAIMKEPDRYCLTRRDKDKIAGIAVRYRAKTKDKNPRINVPVFDRLMEDI